MLKNTTGLMSFLQLVLLITLMGRVTGIIRGEPADALYPFFVGVVFCDDSSCGVTVIAPDTVITAAHCLYSPKEKLCASFENIIILKSDFPNKHWPNTSILYQCEHYKKHGFYKPDVNEGFNPYDTELIKLTESMIFKDPQIETLQPCADVTLDVNIGYAIGINRVGKIPGSKIKCKFSQHTGVESGKIIEFCWLLLAN